MIDIKVLLEDVKKLIMETQLTSFEETYEYEENGGVVTYPTYVKYEIIGVFSDKNCVKLMVAIKKIECHENVLDTMIEDFKKRIQNEITQKNPDLQDYIDILPIKTKELKKLSECAFEF